MPEKYKGKIILQHFNLFSLKIIFYVRKEKMFQPVETNIEVVIVRRKTTTGRGEKYLQAGEVNNSLVQDRYKKQVGVAVMWRPYTLYPSLLDTQVA